MRKKLKPIAFFLTLLFLTTACADSSSLESTEIKYPALSPSPELQADPTPTVHPPQFDDVAEDLQGTEIEFWYVWNRYGDDPFQEMADQFNSSNEYGITVNAVNKSDFRDLDKDLNEGILSGELPEIALGYNYQYLGWDADDNTVIDMIPYTYDPSFGLGEEAISDFYPVFWDHDLIDGKRYGLPAQRTGQVILYNQTWAEELGFEKPPRNPEEFKQQACVASVKKGDGTGGWFINTSPASVLSWVYAFGGDVTTNEDSYDFDTPEASAAFEFLYDLKDTGCAWQPGTLYPNDDFATRRGLFYTSSVVGIPIQQDAFEIAGNEDEWIPIPFPGLGGTSVITVYGPSYVILSSTPKEQLAAWLFIKYMLEPINQAVLVEADGSFPISRSTVSLLRSNASVNSQWFAAVELLDYGKFEPRYLSWSKVRAALQDAAGILFTINFDSAEMADLLEQLQSTAEELHAMGGGN